MSRSPLRWDRLRAGREAMPFLSRGCHAAFPPLLPTETPINAFTATKAKTVPSPIPLAFLSSRFRPSHPARLKSGHFDRVSGPHRLSDRSRKEEKKPVKSRCCQSQKAATHKAPRWPSGREGGIRRPAPRGSGQS